MLDAGHTFREDGLALPGQLFLGVEPIHHVGRIEIATGTASERDRNRGKDGGGNQALRAAHRYLI